MTQRLKVLLLIPQLRGGGAARVTALLARGLSREKYDLHLGLVTQASSDSLDLPPWLKLHALGAERVRSGAFRLLRLVRLLKPDVILSGMAHLNFLVLLLRPLFPSTTRVLVRQNGTVSTALAFGDLPSYTRLLYRLLYRRADRAICQSQAMAEDLATETGLAAERIAVLPNPVDINGIRTDLNEGSNCWIGSGPHLLAVGRLASVKGFDLLLRALGSVRREFPSADLLIAGAGPEEIVLKSVADELGLRDAVYFAGHVNQPASYFAGATLFVLSSRHEGMPNALLEAAAGGLPIVALPASQGVADLLRDRPGVWLAPEPAAAALSNALLTALRSLQPGQRFLHPFVEQFSLSRSIRAYEQLIDATVSEYRP